MSGFHVKSDKRKSWLQSECKSKNNEIIYETKEYLFVSAVTLLLSSCAVPRIAYFQDRLPGNAEQLVNPKYKISILVNSKDPLLMELFNLPIISR